MDNFERLFNEKRKNQEKNFQLGNVDKMFSEMVNSDWFKYKTLGIQHYSRKDFSKAIECLNQAIKIKNDHHHLLQIRANIKEDAGDSEGAIRDFKESLSISGSDWYSNYHQIGINYTRLKNFEKALISYDIAIELKENLFPGAEDLMPSNVDGVVTKIDNERMYTNRANVKLSLSDFDGCLADCQKAVDINPNYANSYFIAGLLYLQVGENEGARKVLTEAERRGHPQARNVIQQYLG